MGYSHHNRYDGAPDPAALWNLIDNVRGSLSDNVRGYLPFQVPDSAQIDRGHSRPTRSVHATVLGILADGPRHGGQIVREIAEKDNSADAPGAAEIYPELQLLVDDGLATVDETDGRRTFTLTESGRAAAADTAADQNSAPWDSFARLFDGRGELPKSGVKLGQAVHQIAISGDEDQRRRATELLDETRRNIYGILAEDSSADGAADD